MVKRTFVAATIAMLGLTVSASADEGMWTFDAFPADKVRAAYGWAPDSVWLDRVREASVRLTSGCSASLVSREGLVLTNWHCSVECAQNNSTTENQYVKTGYTAMNREDEKACPGVQAEVLMSITDMTERVKAAIAQAPSEEAIKARDAAIALIEAEACKDLPKNRCQVVNLYHGGQFKLYTYRKYTDVRLVFIPEEAIGFFGGDPDNFNFPRYELDVSFVRLYEDGKPAATPAHLAWRKGRAQGRRTAIGAGQPGLWQPFEHDRGT